MSYVSNKKFNRKCKVATRNAITSPKYKDLQHFISKAGELVKWITENPVPTEEDKEAISKELNIPLKWIRKYVEEYNKYTGINEN